MGVVSRYVYRRPTLMGVVSRYCIQESHACDSCVQVYRRPTLMDLVSRYRVQETHAYGCSVQVLCTGDPILWV